MKKYLITLEKTQRGKVLSVKTKIVESALPPKVGEGRAFTVNPPIHETIIKVKEIADIGVTKETILEEAKPCPFCGGQPSLSESDAGAPFPGGYYGITCENKDCMMTDVSVDLKEHVENREDAYLQALEIWNTRNTNTAGINTK